MVYPPSFQPYYKEKQRRYKKQTLESQAEFDLKAN